MFVIADKPMSGTESRVFDWLKGWAWEFKIPGIAITNAYVAGQEVDLIVINPVRRRRDRDQRRCFLRVMKRAESLVLAGVARKPRL